jgi:hypothetical protein
MVGLTDESHLAIRPSLTQTTGSKTKWKIEKKVYTYKLYAAPCQTKLIWIYVVIHYNYICATH